MEGIQEKRLLYLGDRMYLPIQYKELVEMPSYRGEGQHSVRELEAICKQYKEYCHQQQIIKQNAMKIVIENKFGVEFQTDTQEY